jgi:hypothetical protein
MLDNLAVLVQAKYVHPCPILIAGPLLVTVQDNVISFGDHSFKRHTLSGELSSHSGEVLNECFLAVCHARVVLDVHITGVSLESLSRLALIKHQIVESSYRSFVVVNALHELILLFHTITQKQNVLTWPERYRYLSVQLNLFQT